MKSMLKIENLSGGYHTKEIIKNVSFDVGQQEFLGIIGPNGSGKSTLLKLASRELDPFSGKVSFQGTNIASLPLKELCRKIAFVPQDTQVNFAFTSSEIVLLGRTPHLKRLQTESKEDYQIAHNAMSLTDTLRFKNDYINELSSGERQRVIIAKALTQEPLLLFLDEPTSHLDIGHQIQILDLLKRLNREKKLTVIIVFHDLNLASEYCNRILLLNEGQIYRLGTPEDVLTYQAIETVYKTVVVVKKNPITSKPYIILGSNLSC
ncbi:MAG: ABC transporter ATP-binding protein [Candidatus Omnitrophota bacterium]